MLHLSELINLYPLWGNSFSKSYIKPNIALTIKSFLEMMNLQDIYYFKALLLIED